MIHTEFKTSLNGKRLKVEYFEGDIYIEDMDNRKCYEYMINMASKFKQLASKALKEADKYGGQE